MLHLSVSKYGSHPTGQLLVAYTMNLLHQSGYEPTIGDLCRATNLPKSSVSRYVSWQIKEGYALEAIDPNDRRIRRLKQTEKGRTETSSMVKDLAVTFSHVDEVVERIEAGTAADPEKILARMEEFAKTFK